METTIMATLAVLWFRQSRSKQKVLKQTTPLTIIALIFLGLATITSVVWVVTGTSQEEIVSLTSSIGALLLLIDTIINQEKPPK